MFFRSRKRGFCIPALLLIFISSPSEAKRNAYEVSFRGVGHTEQKKALKESSSLVRHRKRSPHSLAALHYRAAADATEFLRILRAYGYYDARVTTEIIRKKRSGKYKVFIIVDKGAPYLLQEFDMYSCPGNSFDLSLIRTSDIDLYPGEPARTDKLLDGENLLADLLRQKGYPFGTVRQEEMIVDQAQKTVDVRVSVDSGPRAYFGKATIVNESRLTNDRFIRNRICWKRGELYDENLLRKTEKELYDTGLFATVTVTGGDKLVDRDQLPVTVTVTDAKFNALTFGGSYTPTWEGFGGNAVWTTRNVFRSGTDLQVNGNINQKVREAGLKFIIPDFLSPVQTFVIQSEASDNHQPDFYEKGVNTLSYVERKFNRFFSSSLGVKFDFFQTTRSDYNSLFSLFGIPLHINYQSSDYVLINPTQGGWASFSFTPLFKLRESNPNFAQLRVEGSAYQYLLPNKRLILALNAVFGTLFGRSSSNIPPPYRYYAGSPDHLRGYPYQKAGPLDDNGNPIGGNSLFLCSVEPRIVLLKSVELVGFLDVGNVYLSTWPKWDEAMLKSLGVGVRYFSFVGPLRLDIGFPMNKRPNIRKNYQIYFSFGQAF